MLRPQTLPKKFVQETDIAVLLIKEIRYFQREWLFEDISTLLKLASLCLFLHVCLTGFVLVYTEANFVGIYFLHQGENVRVCEIAPELKEKLKQFRFRKEKDNAAIIGKKYYLP